MKIEDPSPQLEDGLRLIALVESLTGESLGRYHKNPRLQPHMIENLNLPLNLVNESVRSKGLKVFFSAEDILDGNMKMILGLFWILISKFMIDYISDGDKSAREGLLLWCQRRTKNYDNVQVTDLYKSFQDGLAFCAIFHSRDPNSVPYITLTAAGKFQNLEKAFAAGEAIGVPRLIDVEDLKQGGAYMGQKTVMTYLSMMWQAMAEDKKSEQAQEHLKKVIAKERATHGLKQGFAEKAAALTQWIGEQAGFFRGLQFGKEEAAVHDCVTGLNEYRRVTKPTKASEKAGGGGQAAGGGTAQEGGAAAAVAGEGGARAAGAREARGRGAGGGRAPGGDRAAEAGEAPRVAHQEGRDQGRHLLPGELEPAVLRHRRGGHHAVLRVEEGEEGEEGDRAQGLHGLPQRSASACTAWPSSSPRTRGARRSSPAPSPPRKPSSGAASASSRARRAEGPSEE